MLLSAEDALANADVQRAREVMVAAEVVFMMLVLLVVVLQIEGQVVEDVDLELEEVVDLEDVSCVTMDHNVDQVEQ